MGRGARVLLADDNVLIRDLIGAILGGTDEFEIVASATDADGAGAAAAEHFPHIALVDVRMPGGGPAAARAVREASPGTVVIALSSADDAASVRLMLAAGAVSYVVKGTPADELLATMRSVLAPAARGPAAYGPAQRVLIALTDPGELDRLADAVMDTEGLELIGLAQTAYHAISLAARLRPEVAVIDPAMSSGGARLAASLGAASPKTRVVASLEDVVGPLTASASERDRRRFDRLAAVLAAGRVDLEFQPIVGLAGGAPRGYEALARFPGHPSPGPDVWFAEAHRAEVGVELERLAVRCAVAEIGRLPADAFLSVNVSPDTAVSPGLLEDLTADVAPRIVVELTEHAPVRDYAELGRALDVLRGLGARVAVDDCGGGFTSLRHVALIAPDFLKLDMMLCRDVREPARAALARALVAFAAETGSAVIAEGIEEPEDLVALRSLGVDLGQGFLLSRPAPADTLLSP